MSAHTLKVAWEGVRRTVAIRAELLKNRNFDGYLSMFDGHKRLPRFLEIHRDMPNCTYWRCLALAWSNIEVSAPDLRTWIDLFENNRPRREHLMTIAERRALAALPDTLRVFRGYAKGRARRGLSWTLSESVAKRFAVYAVGSRRASMCGHEEGAAAMLATGTCSNADVLAYFNGRQEEEIVIHPSRVHGLRSRQVDGG